MILNIFQDIRDIIYQLFSKFDLGSLIVLLLGVILGFLLFGMLYVIVILGTLKKQSKEYDIVLDDLDNEKITRIIENAKNEYMSDYAPLSANDKLIAIKDLSWQIISDIAKVYYPDSEYPVYELSIEELMMLNHYITNRLNDVFAGKMLGMFKRVKISQILKLLDFKKRIDEQKAVKFANKYKLPTVFKSVMTVVNLFNPVYWVRKIVITSTLEFTTNKVATVILEVVGNETNKVYSKNQAVFQKEQSQLSQTIQELEQMLEEEK